MPVPVPVRLPVSIPPGRVAIPPTPCPSRDQEAVSFLVQLRIWPCGIFLTPAPCRREKEEALEEFNGRQHQKSICSELQTRVVSCQHRKGDTSLPDLTLQCLVSAAAVDHCESVSDALIGRCRLAVFRAERGPSHPRPSPHRLFH
ncbi:hypothetical protein KVT40_002945 [Elsinoe batatas]|uniref:Uncharacterized protein n=1 Tax=Elsinoe batatas TaxID=2601811 RepID=A0A8K0L7U3_9PEZI|nr:hypothetical protein KVT40_002945 [Elsinoe batatas]